MKTRIVPSSELDPAKGLRAADYIPGAHYDAESKRWVLVRVSDNVLEEEDFPVLRVCFRQERIVAISELKEGVYVIGALHIGMHVDEFLRWLKYDATGTHPEEYHEVFDPISGRWWSVGMNLPHLQEIFSRNYQRMKAGKKL